MTDRLGSEQGAGRETGAGGQAGARAPVVLASGSPRRRELLGGLGVEFRVLSPDIEELSAEREPGAVAEDLARQKARAVAARLRAEGSPSGTVVIAADTLVALGEDILGKPRDAAQNLAFLERLSGRTHQVCSGVALLVLGGQGLDGQAGADTLESGLERVQVTFRALSAGERQFYARSGEGLDKAGGYGVQGLGMALVSRVAGDYSAVVGLPLALVTRLLRRAGVPVWGELEEGGP